MGTERTLSVLDYWRWACSDLLSNRERGILAEFLVASALEVGDGVRVEWDATDVVTANRFHVEVKSAAYVQSWQQNDYSRISFNIAPRKSWNAATNTFEQEASRSAQVYVFCLLAEKDVNRVDPLDVGQWRFWVVPTAVLNEQLGDQKSIGLRTLEGLTEGDVRYEELTEAVEAAVKR